MNPILLNSIYNKEDHNKFNDLSSLVEYYTKKVFLLFFSALENAEINHPSEKIKVTNKYSDGQEMTRIYPAGEHFMNLVLYSDDYKKEMEKINKMFYENCPCKDKKYTLSWVHSILEDLADESVNLEEWLKMMKASFKVCPENPE